MARTPERRRALCLADSWNPLFLSLYSSFEADFAQDLPEACNLLFAHSYDIIVLDFDVWQEGSLLFARIAQRVCSWVPLLGFYSPDSKHLVGPGSVEHRSFSGYRKETIRQRVDDIALDVINEEERRFKETCGPVSPLFMDQYNELVRQTHALYHRNDLLLCLDRFAEELLEIFPGVVASVLYVQRAAAVTCSHIPLPRSALDTLHNEMITNYHELADRPVPLEELDLEYRGVVARGGPAEMPLQASTVTPVLERGALVGFLMLTRVGPADEGRDDENARYQAKYCAKYLHEAFLLFNEIRNKAITEPLSGLYNYAFLKEYLRKMWPVARKQKTGLGVLLFDIDRLKHISDCYGLAVGDAAIRAVASIVSELAAPDHVAARYRDDAFVLVLNDTTPEHADRFAETLLEQVRKHVLKEVGFSLHLTVSIGVAVSGTMNERDGMELLDLADKALMLAKRSGANQACNALEILADQVNALLGPPPNETEEPPGKAKILIVDDDDYTVKYLLKLCSSWGYDVTGVQTAHEALDLVQTPGARFDVVLADVSMPEMSGLKMARLLATVDSDLVTVMVTGHGTAENAIEALRAGVYNFALKPVNPDELEMIVQRAVEHRRLLLHRREHRLRLEELLNDKTRALQQSVDAIKDAYVNTLETIVSAVDVHGAAHTEHSRRVSAFAVFLGRKLGIKDEELSALGYAGLFHDIGKIGIPEVDADGPTPSREQIDRLRAHIELSHRIVATIPMFAEAAEIVLAHREHVDGTGHPFGLKSQEIPFGARVLAVVDAFDRWRYDRADARGLPLKEVVERINEFAGTRFAPEVVRAFNNCHEELDALFMQSEKFWQCMEFPQVR